MICFNDKNIEICCIDNRIFLLFSFCQTRCKYTEVEATLSIGQHVKINGLEYAVTSLVGNPYVCYELL